KMDRLCFVMSADHPWPQGKVEVPQLVRQEAFKARVGKLAPLPFGTVEDFRHRGYLSLAAWLKPRTAPTAPAAPVPSDIRARNPNFVGRKQELTRLRDALSRVEMVGICA